MTGSKRLLMFAPNGGTSLSTGGGVNFLFRLAERLITVYGFDVYLTGFHTLPESVLIERYFDMIERVRDHIHVVSGNLSENYFSIFSHVPFKLSAYDAMLSRAFSKWVSNTIERLRPDYMIFNDDVPIAASRFLNQIPSVLYVHFPMAARTPKIIPPMKWERPRVEALNEFFLLRLIDRLVLKNPEDLLSKVLVNSSVTSNALGRLGRGNNHDIFFPFWTTLQENFEIKKFLTSVGTIHKEKRHELLLNAISQVKKELNGQKVVIAGFSREAAYLKKLKDYILKENLQDFVILEVNAHKERLQEVLRNSLGVFQLGEFEPLGITPLEGMRYGAVGVARKSEYSGAYTDILDRGTYGLGFEDGHELSDMILKLLDESYYQLHRKRSVSRVSHYTRDRFTEQMTKLFPFGVN